MSDSPLKQQLTEAMKDAMRAKDKPRLGTIRLALSDIKRIEVDERIELDDARIIDILDKMVKQRRESIRQFESAQRADLVTQEQYEINVIQEFMPAALSPDELATIIKTAFDESGAETMKDMGKVMNLVRPQVVGRADMAEVSKQIKALLA
ncbi:MAG: GatB/YqeY domain-containing protein [Pseudohongiella sp.]|nr:GatB/YqeY domain-containing protein [Pseudohongiella sp.]